MNDLLSLKGSDREYIEDFLMLAQIEREEHIAEQRAVELMLKRSHLQRKLSGKGFPV